MTDAVAAVDLGATSGRVMLGYVGHNELSVRPVARFPNTPVRTIDGLHWNILELYRNVVAGLASAVQEEPSITSVAVDSWAVDYALMRDGRMLGTPYHYRDERTVPAVEQAHALVGPDELYAANGLQFLSFNTLYQFTADRDAGTLQLADGFLLIPDLINYWLTGERFAEQTNASTTGLLNIATGQWDHDLIGRLDLPRGVFPELIAPGTSIGRVLPGIGLDGLSVTAVGSHDTASAVVAVPSIRDDFAYISCGTWGLVGVELDSPVLTAQSRAANFTNEGGVGDSDGTGRVRYLHNVMGLWLLSESVREWQLHDPTIELAGLLAAASALTTPVPLFDADDPTFTAPGGMPDRIAAWCQAHDVAAPRTPVEFVRSIIESLAVAFVDAVHSASRLSGRSVSVIHIVGGGSQNELLCQLIANRSGIPVLAGPVEATAIGNVLIQARTRGLVSGSLESLRSLVASAFSPRIYHPR